MTDITDERITPAVALNFRERQIAYWRSEARENLRLGFMDLARTCEANATVWEFGEVIPPCGS